MNYRIVGYTLGWVLNIEGVCLLLPFICSLIYHEKIAYVYPICVGICLLFGILLTARKPKNKAMYAKEGLVTVALSWIVMSIFGSLPFVISGSIPSVIDAVFETVSGFTTTGASILSDVEALPKSVAFWRSFTHWIGGMGVLVFLVALVPLSGGSNMYLIKAESTGPSVSKLVPKVKSTAKILYSIYLGMTLILIIILRLGGMNLFESLITAFGSAGTGGFGVRNSSLAEYSPFLQYVVAVAVLLFGVDFSVYYLILMGKKDKAFRSDEVKAYFLIAALATAAICIVNMRTPGLDFTGEEHFRHSLFQVTSIMTTTGFATTDFNLWPEFSKMILVALMFIGACAGSTGGGIKVSRVLLLLKSVGKEAKLAAHPKSVHKISMNGRPVAHETIRAVNVFMVAYLVIMAVSVLIISADGHSFTTNFTAVAATLNNIGPGLDVVGPTSNFGFYSVLSKIVLILDMLMGRLEIFPMLVLFSPYSRKK